MNKPKSSKILQYRFEDTVAMIKATIVGNLLMGLIILLAGFKNFTEVPQTQYCLATGLLVWIIFHNYRWKNTERNALFAVLYLMGAGAELYYLGIPNSPLAFREDTIGKGFLFEISVHLLPYLYVSLRILLVIPLISVTLVSRKLGKVQD
ncbi:MAG TPA: hypothetical protein VJ953_13345 [Saprospiraceae bacterium]|nr:hypothetical protein [Saprospiraceae bacterium]